MIRLLGLFILGLFMGCGGNTDNLTSNNTRDEPYFTIEADQYLQEGHKIAIFAAVNEWAEQTHFTMKYDLKFIDMSKEPKDLNTLHTIRIYVTDPGPGLAGWTEWITGNQSAYTLVEPSIDDNTFRKIMLHELGHAFDLHFGTDVHYHGPYQSVMYPSIGQASEHLGCPDLQAFCKNYSCQVDCDNQL
jgi:hypothetical protein